MKKILLTAFAIVIFNFSTVFAWNFPKNPVQLEGQAKQNYISEQMKILFSKEPIFEVPEGWNYEKFSVDGVPVECLENPFAETDRIIFQVHGGGYVAGLTNGYRNLAVIQSSLAKAKKIFMFDYRIAPKNIFPAAQEDAVKVYKEILNRGINPKKIIVMGDSVGGNLALALSVALKENKIPQPKLMILVSACGTFENNLPSRKNNYERDLILGKNGIPMHVEVEKASYAKNFDKKNPNLSPIYADFKNFPTMLIQAGGYEVLLDDSIEIAKKALAADVKFTLTIYPEMPHDFQYIFPDLKETSDAFKEIQNFIDENMNE